MSLKDNHLFRGLTSEEIDKILPMICLQTVPRGTIIIEEGQTDKVLYVLISGCVQVVKNTPEGRHVLIAERKAGDFFGEMALLEDAPRSARIVAIEPCEVGRIDDIAFNRMMEQEPRVAVNLLKSISARLRQTSEQMIEQFTIRVAEQKKQINRLNQLVEVCTSITERMNRERLLDLIPQFVQKQIPNTSVALMILNESASIYLVATGDGLPVSTLPMSQNPFADLQEKRQHDITDFSALKKNASPESRFLWDQCQRLTLIPLSSQDYADGWIVLKKNDSTPWDENDRAYLETLASYVSVALLNIRLSEHLVTKEKLSAVGRATSSVIHDFKNLLSVVHIYAQMIPRAHSAAETKELVNKILASSNMMIAMSKDILTYARGEIVLNRSYIAVTELMSNVIGLMEQELQKNNITLLREIPADHQYAFDTEKMSRALYNLLKNSAESIERSGGVIRVTSEIADNELIITIADNGKGIPETILQTLFTPFVTTKPEGTGLGMLIAKNIVEAHGGQMDIESREGKGTDVLLSFPLDAGNPSQLDEKTN